MQGLFDLNIFESAADDDILDMAINESDSEFDNGSLASPTEHFDKDNSGEWKISIPDGLGESPKAKPADGEMGPVSINSQSERPTAKLYDANSISTPGKVTLTADQYNQAITQLQKSFKEGADLLAALSEANIVEKSIDELQEEFVEDAVIAAYEDGPYFEAVNKENKHIVKAIVKSIRKPVVETLKKNGINVAHTKTGNAGEYWKAILWGELGVNIPADLRKNIASKSYQTLCSIIATAKVKTNCLKQLNKLYADELKGYEIKAFAIRKSSEVNKADDDEENRYILYVDQTGQEDKEFQKAFMDVSKFVDKDKPVKESYSFTDDYFDESIDPFAKRSEIESIKKSAAKATADKISSKMKQSPNGKLSYDQLQSILNNTFDNFFGDIMRMTDPIVAKNKKN